MYKVHPFLIRKFIHISLASLFILCYLYLPHSRLILGIFTSLVLFLDLSRNFFSSWEYLFLKLFRNLLKSQEQQGQVTGATALVIGLYITAIGFSKDVFFMSAGIVMLADPLAAAGGKLLQTKTVAREKTGRGSIIFFSVTLLILTGYGNIPLIPGLIISIILSAIEFLAHSTWENLYIILAAGISLYTLKVI